MTLRCVMLTSDFSLLFSHSPLSVPQGRAASVFDPIGAVRILLAMGGVTVVAMGPGGLRCFVGFLHLACGGQLFYAPEAGLRVPRKLCGGADVLPLKEV